LARRLDSTTEEQHMNIPSHMIPRLAACFVMEPTRTLDTAASTGARIGLDVRARARAVGRWRRAARGTRPARAHLASRANVGACAAVLRLLSFGARDDKVAEGSNTGPDRKCGAGNAHRRRETRAEAAAFSEENSWRRRKSNPVLIVHYPNRRAFSQTGRPGVSGDHALARAMGTGGLVVQSCSRIPR
jgi:hypothetical protein